MALIPGTIPTLIPGVIPGPIPVGKGREWNGMETVVTAVCGVSGYDQNQSYGDLGDLDLA